MKWIGALLAGAFLVGAAGPAGAAPRVLRVPGDYRGIQQAIENAEPFDTVLVAPGTYNESVVISTPRSGIVLRGEAGPRQTILAGTGGSRLVTFDETDTLTELSGFTLRGGSPQFDGGAVYAYRSQVFISNCEFSGNSTPGDGGAIALYESWALIRQSVITANAARQGGGIFANSSTLILVGNTLSNNVALQDGGGALLLNSVPTLDGNMIIGNSAQNNGGGVAFLSPRGEFRSNVVRGNRARTGGGFYCNGDYQPDLSSSHFKGNTPSDLEGCLSSVTRD
jgi:hypothetical protein